MACALMARLGTPTLVLVHTKPLAEQWRQRIGDLLSGRPRKFVDVGGSGTGVVSSVG